MSHSQPNNNDRLFFLLYESIFLKPAESYVMNHSASSSTCSICLANGTESLPVRSHFAPVMQALKPFQISRDVCGSCLKMEHYWIDFFFWLIRAKTSFPCACPSARLAGPLSTCEVFIQPPNWIGELGLIGFSRHSLLLSKTTGKTASRKPDDSSGKCEQQWRGREREPCITNSTGYYVVTNYMATNEGGETMKMHTINLNNLPKFGF